MKNVRDRMPVEVYPGVFAFDLFTRETCSRLLKKIEAQRSDKYEAPNSMNKYGVVLGGELKPGIASIVVGWVAPISKENYPEINALKKHPYAFSVDYDVGKQRSLSSHVDTSDVTLNVCIGGEFEGGEVVFYEGRKPAFEYKNVVGRAIVHRGSLMHRAKPVTRGWRTNLILWCDAKAK